MSLSIMVYCELCEWRANVPFVLGYKWAAVYRALKRHFHEKHPDTGFARG